MVHLNYTLAVEEVQESQHPITGKGKPIRWVLSLFLWTYNLLAIMFLIYINADRTRASYTENFCLVLVPPLFTVLMMSYNIWLAHHIRFRNMKPQVLSGSAFGRGKTLLISLGYLWPLLLIVLAVTPGLALRWHPSPAIQLMVGLVPWACFLWTVLALAAIRNPSRGKRAIAQWAWLRRSHHVQISDDGITIEDGVIHARFGWPYFIRFRETANLILLHTEQNQPMILPKRAAETEIDLHQLLALIQSNIAQGKFSPRESRFAVVPAIPLQPIDAESEVKPVD